MENVNNCLLAIAIILAVLQINTCLNIISTYLFLYIISYKYFNNIYKSLLYALFLLGFFIVLKILLSYNEKYFGEHFEQEDEKEEKNNLEKLDSIYTKKEIENLDTLSKKEVEKLEGKKVNDGDDEKDKTEPPEKFVSLDKMSPMQAQKELFRLVDTSKMLKDTIEKMAPVLSEGNEIMKAFRQLNLAK